MQLNDYLKAIEIIGSRYFIIAGVAFLLFYVLPKPGNAFKKIQQRFPAAKDYRREIAFSIITITIFGLVPFMLLSNPAVRKHTTYYTDIDAYGWFYFFFAFPVMLLLHDTYFYWTHRGMHHPALFKIFHRLHHRSTNPSPWAAYSFHPLEAIVEAGISALFLFTIPVHLLHLAIFFLFMIIYNVYGHLGYELYPKGFNRHWLGKWINTSLNHNLHHQYFKGNYGLYFLFWDRWMGTIREDYDRRFDEITAG